LNDDELQQITKYLRFSARQVKVINEIRGMIYLKIIPLCYFLFNFLELCPGVEQIGQISGAFPATVLRKPGRRNRAHPSGFVWL